MCWNVKDEVGFNFGKKGELEYWNVTEQIEMAQFAHQKCCLSPVSATPNGDFTTNLSKFHPASTQPTYGRLQCWLKMISGYVKSPGMFHLTFCSTTTNHMEVSIHGVTHKSSILKQKILDKPSIFVPFWHISLFGNPHETNQYNLNPSFLRPWLSAGVLFIRIFSSTSQFSSVAPVKPGAASSAISSGYQGWTCPRHGNSYFI